ncbi:pyruvate dehydrogenase (acetyl-transferring), homodimeric type [Zunongwangia sp. HRR-M8]|uniref:pyruvate dehydrogenase (acetyl-transferring), homodimeric type n=1 Tax=Zunongwangia sp. HRR-M8 TaxID=3015170 RepID=UPI0022DDFAC5|nr:pyruvate dehydrogenase (acetyl-transferring), homodimeric type [Zunongwangia sp. HRR-M8]WBL21973.1 pyruvate dehydrogenase (acetyl-transferring), homodimeric type [Zunongwangia sp. HRR-M8]
MAKENESNTEIENQEWLDSLRWVLQNESKERVEEILKLLQAEAQRNGVKQNLPLTTSYINTISPEDEEKYPGDIEIEEKILGYIRWNAMAMVVRANNESKGIGGHVSTYSSIAHLWEVGFNHFYKMDREAGSDMVYFQGHASPGVYSRAFLEGRLTEEHLENFRREIKSDKGLTSYPHPHLMPEFWNFPTVSMGLGPINAIYQARFNKYLEKRGLIENNDQQIWAYLGDGEMDEPEARGAISVAARDKLDNLTFVVDCNLQRLDGPVRGNGKIIQELEGLFRGAGWNVIKLLWGKDWDPIFEKDTEGKLISLLDELPDGQLQKYAFSEGEFIREDLFGKDKNLAKIVKNLSDDELKRLKRGGHDQQKIYNAYKKATEHKGQPTIILAQTIKGYGQGKAGEASNVSHKTKSFKEDELKAFRDFFNLPISDKEIKDIPFIKPEEDSEEIKYLQKKRKDLGGFMPQRKDESEAIKAPDKKVFKSFLEGSGDDEAATTMVMIQTLSRLFKDKELGKYIVPIIPDESRTFGMESLFRQVGIYAPGGQLYEPVDKESLLFYKESEDGAIMEEGITESGCMAEFIAAGTSYLNQGIPMIPFYFFYSMFGFQRTGDLIWAAADAGAKGFLVGGISGRTSLPGEGLQHQDGNSHLFALAFPTVKAYDPAFAYELATIVKNGIQEMYVDKKTYQYYITLGNATYKMPKMPKDSEEGILKGMYKFQKTRKRKTDKKAHLFGSGSIMVEVLEAAEILEKEYDVAVDIWSITSYKALYDNAIDIERENRLKTQLNKEKNYIQDCLEEEKGVFVAASDYVKALPESIAKWFPAPLAALGTDGFGRSDARPELRNFFEVNAAHIVFATLYELANEGKIKAKQLKDAAKKFDIDAKKPNPRTS